MRIFFLVLSGILLFSSCSKDSTDLTPRTGLLVQVSVIDALLQGIYDGFYPIGDLHQHGNYGLGTFDALDGEMIVFNDTVFQVVSSGEVKRPSGDVLTPFAALTFFHADTSFVLNELTFDSIKTNFDRYFPTPNVFYIVKMKGRFTHMKTRSVPKQIKPFLPLAEITATQPEFTFEDVSGDVIGFYCPDYAKGINVNGLHLHFLSGDRTGGGHILEFTLNSGTMEIGYLLDYRLILPNGGDFYGGDFTVDRSEDLENAEN